MTILDKREAIRSLKKEIRLREQDGADEEELKELGEELSEMKEELKAQKSQLSQTAERRDNLGKASAEDLEREAAVWRNYNRDHVTDPGN